MYTPCSCTISHPHSHFLTQLLPPPRLACALTRLLPSDILATSLGFTILLAKLYDRQHCMPSRPLTRATHWHFISLALQGSMAEMDGNLFVACNPLSFYSTTQIAVINTSSAKVTGSLEQFGRFTISVFLWGFWVRLSRR